jgi:hypothetical protein
VKYLPVHAVPEGERFLVKLIGPMISVCSVVL